MYFPNRFQTNVYYIQYIDQETTIIIIAAISSSTQEEPAAVYMYAGYQYMLRVFRTTPYKLLFQHPTPPPPAPGGPECLVWPMLQ